jgi:hypothetical protein
MSDTSEYFLKIPFSFFKEDVILDEFKGSLRVQVGTYFHYYNLINPSKLFQLDVFARLQPDFFSWVELQSNDSMYHKDQSSQVNLNVYLNPNGGVTEFFNLKEKDLSYNYTKVSKIFRKCDLIPVCSFKAEPYEAWLVNAQQIHKVHSVDTTKGNRILIQMTWREKTFKEVASMLTDLCNIKDENI